MNRVSPELEARMIAEPTFRREERYIVIKRKHLSSEHEDDIRELLSSRDTPTIDCVVVESDWPEYELVWKMIEDRVTGKSVTDAGDEDLRATAQSVVDNANRSYRSRGKDRYIEDDSGELVMLVPHEDWNQLRMTLASRALARQESPQ